MPTKPKKPPGRAGVKKGSAAEDPNSQQSARVRMYRQGHGDCFLITFPRLGQPFQMLIDCGVVMGDPRAIKRLQDVVRDIKKTTGGRLDLLVVTHEHWDKISGFTQARKIFDGIEVEEVWMGWPQNPQDEGARRLRSRLEGMLAGSGTRSAEAIDYVRGKGKTLRYWEPGSGPVALPGVTGVRIFILGPPRSGTDLSSARAAAARVAGLSPFAPDDHIDFQQAADAPEFANYFHRDADGNEVGWRRFDRPDDRLPRRVRLNFDALRNDTSLVLAIELISQRGPGKVLLFPGDAQIQSWLSWHMHRWPADTSPGSPRTITCRELLERTVLYKASHNGANTGTPLQYGLELMTSPELAVMIPVDHAAAAKKKWFMPDPKLLVALARQTDERVIRSDNGLPPPPPADGDMDRAAWERFRERVHMHDLYIDYHVDVPLLTAAERQGTAQSWLAANERRVYLVDKKLAGSIKPAEEAELREIEKLMDEYLSVTAPTGFGLLAKLNDSLPGRKAGRR